MFHRVVALRIHYKIIHNNIYDVDHLSKVLYRTLYIKYFIKRFHANSH